MKNRMHQFLTEMEEKTPEELAALRYERFRKM